MVGLSDWIEDVELLVEVYPMKPVTPLQAMLEESMSFTVSCAMYPSCGTTAPLNLMSYRLCRLDVLPVSCSVLSFWKKNEAGLIIGRGLDRDHLRCHVGVQYYLEHAPGHQAQGPTRRTSHSRRLCSVHNPPRPSLVLAMRAYPSPGYAPHTHSRSCMPL